MALQLRTMGKKLDRITRLPTTLAAQLLDTNSIGRRGAALAERDEKTSRQEVWKPEVEENGAPNGSGSRQNWPSGPEIRLESTRGKPGRRGTARRGSGGSVGSSY